MRVFSPVKTENIARAVDATGVARKIREPRLAGVPKRVDEKIRSDDGSSSTDGMGEREKSRETERARRNRRTSPLHLKYVTLFMGVVIRKINVVWMKSDFKACRGI